MDAQLKNDTQRIDAIWDNYPEENNIKALTEKRRGNQWVKNKDRQ